jgi:hypothetical protein
LEQKEIFNEKLSILKHETSILSDKSNQIIDRLWKIRQVALTLWLAAVGVGLGAITQNGKAFVSVLAISVFIPVWFCYIEARYHSWYRRFNMRENEIRKFISQEDYIMPSTQAKISFEKCLINEKLIFPVYDLSGEQTFGNDGNYKWEKSLIRSYTDQIPIFFYWIQILVSVLFLSLECHNLGYLKNWWYPLTLSFFSMLVVYIFARFRKRILRRSKR